MKKCIFIALCTILIFISYSTVAQDRRHHLSFSPISASELGYGIGASYQYSVSQRIGVEIPVSINWNLSHILYGPDIIDVYKSQIVRIMPNIKYYGVNNRRFKYGAGLGFSFGMGKDEELSENHRSSFNQLGIFVDNGVMLFNNKGSFGIGADLGIGYQFYDNIAPLYQHHHQDYFLRFGFKLIYRF